MSDKCVLLHNGNIMPQPVGRLSNQNWGGGVGSGVGGGRKREICDMRRGDVKGLGRK